MYTITGTLKLKKDTQKVSDTFQKREFIITDNSSNYPQHISLELKKDKCSILDNFNVGDVITVSFFIGGREWTKDGVTKYFNSLDAWKIESKSGAVNQGKPEAPKDAKYATEIEEDGSSLPF